MGTSWEGSGRGLQLDHPELEPVLAYPSGDRRHLEAVRRDLRSLGVEGITSFGRNSIGSFWVLGKGWVGIVCLGSIGGRQVAVKVRRTDADRPNMLNEAKMHIRANSVGVGPKLLGQAENVLAMEYVKGLPVIRWLETPPGPASGVVNGTVSDLLDQCYRLDRAGLDHGELSDSKKHVLVDVSGRPVIIDFETASASRITRNVVAMTGYLFCKDALEKAMRRHFNWDALQLRRCLKDYKESKREDDYCRLREAIGIRNASL